MDEEYKKQLKDQYDWFIKRIDEIIIKMHWNSIPMDSFFFRLENGSIVPKLDDIEWLEETIPKLQNLLSMIEIHIEREEYKKIKGMDTLEKLKKI
jgi:hypothetical protein